MKDVLAVFKNSSNNKFEKKGIDYWISLVVILIVLIIVINFILNKDRGTKSVKSPSNTIEGVLTDGNLEVDYSIEDDLEKKLENVLSSISGVGQVKVLITYNQTSTINPVYNEDLQESTTQEEDTNGGKRTISTTNNKKEIITSNNNIVTQSIQSPQIQGAVIIAKGAGDINVKANIIQAVQAATGLSVYKIQVFEMN